MKGMEVGDNMEHKKKHIINERKEGRKEDKQMPRIGEVKTKKRRERQNHEGDS